MIAHSTPSLIGKAKPKNRAATHSVRRSETRQKPSIAALYSSQPGRNSASRQRRSASIPAPSLARVLMKLKAGHGSNADERLARCGGQWHGGGMAGACWGNARGVKIR